MDSDSEDPDDPLELPLFFFFCRGIRSSRLDHVGVDITGQDPTTEIPALRPAAKLRPFRLIKTFKELESKRFAQGTGRNSLRDQGRFNGKGPAAAGGGCGEWGSAGRDPAAAEG